MSPGRAGTGLVDGTPADVGRIKDALARKAQRLYYGAADDADDAAALRSVAQVDRAHLVMLAEQRILAQGDVAVLLRTVERLERSGFAAVLGRPRPRGLYLAYESVVTELCGAAVGGLLHTGRSRNDLNATTTLLALRDAGIDVVAEGVRLLTALLAAAGRHRDTVMVIHTHYQPAMPITYGYYLTGVALALQRELERVLDSLRSLRRCPLGAHAVAGTDLPLDTTRTARLLGFEEGPLHAVDTIASRDVALHLLGIAAGVGTTVSRLATDLQMWSTTELGYLWFPDWLVGSSSAMPQKRNAFLLEYLKSRPSQVVGAWVGSVVATKATPFTNSIEAGGEAMRPVFPALRTTQDVLALTALVVAGAQPRPEVAAAAAGSGFVDATAMANELVRRGVPFREAHGRVGAAVLDAVERGGRWPPEGLEQLGIEEAVRRARYGGGPGSRADSLEEAWRLRHALHREARRLRRDVTDSTHRLHRAAGEVARG